MQTTDQAKPAKPMGKTKAQALLDQYQMLKGQRSTFESFWQSLHDYFYIESQDVNKSYHPGTELTMDALYDSTTLEAADVLASGFMNYLTPPTSRWAMIRAKDQSLRDNKRVARWCADAMDEVNYTLNKSNFYDQMFVNYKGSGVYGTSAMLEEEDIETDVRFYSLPIKQIVLVEDGRGRVVEYFIEFEYTARQAADRWGEDKLSENMRQELDPDNRKENKHAFLLHIATRAVLDVRKSDKRNLPIGAIWIDVENKMTIDEGGYHEMPAFCHRFDKRPFIPWGYSPAMKALPFARILNAIAKTNLRAMMKITDPPVAVPDNAFIMPFSGNPRSVNYYNKAKMSAGDIFPFSNFGDPKTGMAAVEYYSMKVKALMYNDAFLAFDNITKQMNNPEVMERINEKMSMLGPAVGRYIAEMVNPTIIRTLGILFRRGRLPDLPDELIMNPEYEIDCISQLAQAQRRSEMTALMSGLTLVGQMAPLVPDVLDKIDPDKVVDEAWNIFGSPVRVLRDDDDVAKIREAKAQAAAQVQQMQMLEKGAGIVKTGSEVDANLAKTQEKK